MSSGRRSAGRAAARIPPRSAACCATERQRGFEARLVEDVRVQLEDRLAELLRRSSTSAASARSSAG